VGEEDYIHPFYYFSGARVPEGMPKSYESWLKKQKRFCVGADVEKNMPRGEEKTKKPSMFPQQKRKNTRKGRKERMNKMNGVEDILREKENHNIEISRYVEKEKPRKEKNSRILKHAIKKIK